MGAELGTIDFLIMDTVEHQTAPIVPETSDRFPRNTIETNAERINRIEFQNIPEDRETDFRNLLLATGLPLDYVDTVGYEKNTDRTDKWLGSYNYGERKMNFFELADKLPERALLGVAAHEEGHSLDPFTSEHTDPYGSTETRMESAQHAVDIAHQSLITDRYLTGYHAWLAEELAEGNIDLARFYRETYAIMVELRVSDPKKLEQLEEVQRNELEKMKSNYDNAATFEKT